MIRIDRSTAEAPEVLRSKEATQSLKRAADFFASETRADQQRQFEFNEELLFDQAVTRPLTDLFANRCAFCSRSQMDASELDLRAHRLRPPQNAVGRDGSTSRRHYWWLAYQWSNLYLACVECRIAQGAKFPVEGKHARVGTADGLANERPLLIDPCLEDPEAHLVYLDSGEVVAADSRGTATIETFELNRPALQEDRAAMRSAVRVQLTILQRALDNSEADAFIGGLTRLYDRDAHLAAQRRQLVNQWVQFRPHRVGSALWAGTQGEVLLGELVGDLHRVTNMVKDETASIFFGKPLPLERAIEKIDLADESSAVARLEDFDVPDRTLGKSWSYLEAAEIRSIEIRNFRAIEHMRLDVARGPAEGSWLMLLGENGTGKSSVLQAVALALTENVDHSELSVKPEEVLRKGSEEGLVRVRLSGTRRFREIRFGAGHRGFTSRASKRGVMIAGYGATRRLGRGGGERPRSKTKVASLFDPFVPLSRPSGWLSKLPPEEFHAVARSLKRLLELDEGEEIGRRSGEVELISSTRTLRLTDLSDGYQAMCAFALDLMELLLTRWGSLEAAEGIVLIDELGAHLHPRWQMQVTGAVRSAFPRVQFIATTHDPLCLRGLHDGEVAVLRQHDDKSYALQGDDLPPVEGMAVDQLLTSQHFGLSSTRDPEFERRFERYYELLGKRRRSGKEDRELVELRQGLEKDRLFGSTLRERLALEAADQTLADEQRAGSAKEVREIKAEAMEILREIWRSAHPT